VTRVHKGNLTWRDVRGWLIAQEISLDRENGFLDIKGVVNGNGLCSSELVHITGIGDFEVQQIMGSLDPNG